MEEIKGTIEKIIKKNQINSFAIFEFSLFNKQEESEIIIAKGTISPIYTGVSFKLSGQFTENKIENNEKRTFEIYRYELISVPDIKNLKKNAKNMLTSEPFCFSTTEANVIIKELKNITIESILRDFNVLKRIDKIDPNKIQEVIERLTENQDLFKIADFLKKFDIPASRALKLYSFYKDETIEILSKTPVLAGLEGALDLQLAFHIARELNIPVSNQDNLSAIVVGALQSFENNGNTYTQMEKVTERILKSSNITDEKIINDTYKFTVDNNFVRVKKLNGHYYLSRSITAMKENEIAEGIQRISGISKPKFNINTEIEYFENKIKIKFSEEQKTAIRTAFKNNFSIITGPAGCGKTSVLGAITKIFRKNYPSSSVLLCAPTGKAATRMTESTGMSAFTVHHALNMRPVATDEDVDFFESKIILNHDLIILDEGSMLDNDLASIFFTGIKTGAKVIILGDSNQLPSVSCGNVLADLISSGCVPVTQLTSIFRQGETSPIIINANKIKAEDDNISFCKGFEFIPASTEEEASKIAVNEFLRIFPSVGKENISLLSPYRYKTKTGCNYLNKIIEPIVNQEKTRKYSDGEKIFKKGDIVIRTRNDNQQHICNGAIGIVSDINSSGFLIDFGDGKAIFYSFPEFKYFDLAYANTVHKSQGSEYDTVIMIVMPEHIAMLSNSIIYTGVTRAKKRVIIIGNEEALKIGIKKKSDIRRTTLLKYELRNEFIKNGRRIEKNFQNNNTNI